MAPKKPVAAPSKRAAEADDARPPAKPKKAAPSRRSKAETEPSETPVAEPDGLLADDRSVVLTAVRKVLAASIDSAKPSEVPALTRELRMVLAEQASMKSRGVSKVEQIQQRAGQRRAARRAAPAAGASTGRRGQPRRSGGVHRAG